MKVRNMLTFKLISIIDGFYHYEIYPEKKIENKQILIFNPKSKEVKMAKKDLFQKKQVEEKIQKKI